MATKKFAQMSTKKLQALLETSSEEDVVAIKAVLESRNVAATETQSTELTEEEAAALASAEEAVAPAPEKTSKRKVNTEKPTAEEIDALAIEAKQNVGHRCVATMTGGMTFDGTITGILKDKRAGYVFYTVQTDATSEIESRKIYKKVNGQEIEVLDEVVEIVTAKRAKAVTRQAKEKMSDEAWEELYAKIRELAEANIGKTVVIDAEQNISGHITDFLRDNRSQGVYYHIPYINAEGEKKNTYKVVKYDVNEAGEVTLDNYLGLANELDEEGQAIAEKFKNRTPRGFGKKALTIEERVIAAEELVKKAEATLVKAQETLEMRKNQLATLKAELEGKQQTEAENAESEEDLA